MTFPLSLVPIATLVVLSVQARTLFVPGGLRCPMDWDANLDGRRCYRLINRPMPQTFAQKYCRELDAKAKLVRIQDRAENDFVREYTYSGDIWLEAKAKFDIIDSKAALFSPGLVLRWKNGKPVKYANWESRNGLEGLDSQHLCVLMNSRGKWTNANCNHNAQFVCERKMDELSSPSVESDCPRKWTFNQRTGACYRAFAGTHNITWLDGDKLCSDAGAQNREDASLASIGNAMENKFVMDLARKRQPSWQYIFLGAIGDTKSRRQWDWVDGTSFKQFHNWEGGMPRGSRRQAVLAMSRTGRWVNAFADRTLPGQTVVVCKFVPN